MVYVGLGGFVGIVLFGLLYVVFFLKGASLKLPLIGMAVCVAAVAASAIRLNFFPGEPDAQDAPDAASEPSETVAIEESDPPAGAAPEDGESEPPASAAPEDEESKPPANAAPEEETVAGQELLDKRGLVITAADFVREGTFGPELKLKIENHSETDVTIQLRNSSVNGYMIDTVCAIEVPAGTDTEDSITFLTASLRRSGIETVAVMEFSFHILDGHRSVFLEDEPVKVTTSAAATYQYSFDGSGADLCSGNGVRILSRGISQDEGGAILFIENATDKAVTVQIGNVSVNGIQADAAISQDIAVGKCAVCLVAAPSAVLEQNGIVEIGRMGFDLRVVEQGSQTVVLDGGSLTV